MERLPWKKKKKQQQKDLQNKLLEGQYIKQWHQNRFDKTKEKKQKAQIFFGCGAFSSFFFVFLPCCLQNNNKKRKINKKICIYSAYIYIKAFFAGEKDG